MKKTRVTTQSDGSAESLRDDIRSTLAALLTPRRDEAGFSLFGGGQHGDLEEERRTVALLADTGFLVARWPVEYGGRGADAIESDMITDELERFDMPDLYPFVTGLSLVGPTVIAEGSDEQRARWLDPIRFGEHLWCQLFSEPDAGSDLAALKTRAVQDGANWRISGSKVWSSRAHYAEQGFLLARTDTAARHAGITAFGIDMSSPGITVRPLKQINGDVHFNEVFFDDVVVPDSDRIGDVGKGWTVTMTALMHERAAVGGTVGMSRQQFFRMVQNSPYGNDPRFRERIIDSLMRLEIARLTEARVRAGRLSGQTPGPEGSIGKLWISETLRELADLCLDLQGSAGMGIVEDWTTLFLTGPSLSIRGGTDEIQRNILGERVLGLPRE